MLTKLLGLPENASSHGFQIDLVIGLLHVLMLLLFVGWGIYFIIALLKFNKRANPKADYTGVKSHTSTYVEIAVAVFEAFILVGLSIPFWSNQINAFPERTDTVEVRILAEQYAWNIHYPGKDGIFGRAAPEFVNQQTNPVGLDPDDPNGKDDIVTVNQLHLPVGRPAVIRLSSKDVIHSFFLPTMRIKQDVIPGMSVPVWFTPTKTGHSEIACAQLCGLGHYRMRGFLTVETEEEFAAWLETQNTSASDEEDEGYDDFWN